MTENDTRKYLKFIHRKQYWNHTKLYETNRTKFNNIRPEHNWYPYIILDKPEIGMSKESQLGLASYLKKNKDTILHNSKSMYIITHSEFLVKELESIYTFLNMNGYKTINEWINRTIITINFNALQEKSSKLFSTFNQKQTSLNTCVRNTTTYTQPVFLNGFFFLQKNTNTECECVNNTLIYTPI